MSNTQNLSHLTYKKESVIKDVINNNLKVWFLPKLKIKKLYLKYFIIYF